MVAGLVEQRAAYLRSATKYGATRPANARERDIMVFIFIASEATIRRYKHAENHQVPRQRNETEWTYLARKADVRSLPAAAGLPNVTDIPSMTYQQLVEHAEGDLAFKMYEHLTDKHKFDRIWTWRDLEDLLHGYYIYMYGFVVEHGPKTVAASFATDTAKAHYDNCVVHVKKDASALSALSAQVMRTALGEATGTAAVGARGQRVSSVKCGGVLTVLNPNAKTQRDIIAGPTTNNIVAKVKVPVAAIVAARGQRFKVAELGPTLNRLENPPNNTPVATVEATIAATAATTVAPIVAKPASAAVARTAPDPDATGPASIAAACTAAAVARLASATAARTAPAVVKLAATAATAAATTDVAVAKPAPVTTTPAVVATAAPAPTVTGVGAPVPAARTAPSVASPAPIKAARTVSPAVRPAHIDAQRTVSAVARPAAIAATAVRVAFARPAPVVATAVPVAVAASAPTVTSIATPVPVATCISSPASLTPTKIAFSTSGTSLLGSTAPIRTAFGANAFSRYAAAGACNAFAAIVAAVPCHAVGALGTKVHARARPPRFIFLAAKQNQLSAGTVASVLGRRSRDDDDEEEGDADDFWHVLKRFKL